MTPAWVSGHPLVLLAVFAVALLYASVGHGGASGYLAVLALFGFAPQSMKASALVLNLLVAAVSFHHFRSAGHFKKSLFWPFAAASIPLAFVGGWIALPARVYAGLLAATLLFAAFRLIVFPSSEAARPPRRPSLGASLGAGGAIGLLSGLVGVGGGIFLSPIMILLGWADAKETAAVSAAFIWVNSASGLIGQIRSQGLDAASLWPLAVAAAAGGWLGASTGARRVPAAALRRLLGLVLLVAVFKLGRMAL